MSLPERGLFVLRLRRIGSCDQLCGLGRRRVGSGLTCHYDCLKRNENLRALGTVPAAIMFVADISQDCGVLFDGYPNRDGPHRRHETLF